MNNRLKTISSWNNIASPSNIYGFRTNPSDKSNNINPGANTGINIALIIQGYFKPDITGTWNFQIQTDDVCVVWMDDKNNVNNTTTHWPPNNTNYNFAKFYNGGTIATVTYQTTLTSGIYYPIQLTWSQAWGESKLIFTFKPPGSSSYIQDGSKYFFSNS